MCYLLWKDYTRDDVNVDNFLAVLFGNQTALTRYQKNVNSGLWGAWLESIMSRLLNI
ncbi:hypothetical protein KY285_032753 [Solanum tuberosum]|nr:hypothetical protein KY285_032753 [Solanum tuberosum]